MVPCGKLRGEGHSLVEVYSDELLLITHKLSQFVHYCLVNAGYLVDMGMSLNFWVCANTTTIKIYTIMVRFDATLQSPRGSATWPTVTCRTLASCLIPRG